MISVKSVLFVSLFAILQRAGATEMRRWDDLPELDIVHSVQVEGGNLTWHGSLEDRDVHARSLSRIAPRCGSNSVRCPGGHSARVDICQGLLSNLGSNQIETAIPNNPRAVCFEQFSGDSSDGKCCVSWSSPINGGVEGALDDPASGIINGCTSSGEVSGIMDDVNIGNSCVNICLSNRATGCK